MSQAEWEFGSFTNLHVGPFNRNAPQRCGATRLAFFESFFKGTPMFAAEVARDEIKIFLYSSSTDCL